MADTVVESVVYVNEVGEVEEAEKVEEIKVDVINYYEYVFEEDSDEEEYTKELKVEQLDDIKISPDGRHIAAYDKKHSAIIWWGKEGHKDKGKSMKGGGHEEGDGNEKEDQDMELDNYTQCKHVKRRGTIAISNICVSDQMKIAYIHDSDISKWKDHLVNLIHNEI